MDLNVIYVNAESNMNRVKREEHVIQHTNNFFQVGGLIKFHGGSMSQITPAPSSNSNTSAISRAINIHAWLVRHSTEQVSIMLQMPLGRRRRDAELRKHRFRNDLRVVAITR